MRKFIITHPTYSGEVSVCYRNDVLMQMDFSKSTLSHKQIMQLKSQIPSDLNQICKALPRSNIVETEYPCTFDMFWDAYGKKINRMRAYKLWQKLNKSEQVNAFYGIKKYEGFLRKDGGWRSKADPETYLRNKYWENEY